MDWLSDAITKLTEDLCWFDSFTGVTVKCLSQCTRTWTTPWRSIRQPMCSSTSLRCDQLTIVRLKPWIILKFGPLPSLLKVLLPFNLSFFINVYCFIVSFYYLNMTIYQAFFLIELFSEVFDIVNRAKFNDRPRFCNLGLEFNFVYISVVIYRYSGEYDSQAKQDCVG